MSSLQYCVVTISLILSVWCHLSFAVKLPSEFKRCHVSNKQFDECLESAVEGAIKSLSAGNKQVGIPPFEPLEIPELIIGAGTGSVNIKQHFKNVQLSGLTNSKVLKYSANINETQFYAESVSPMLQLTGNYDMSGRILLLPVVGSGKCNISLVNAMLTHHLNGSLYEKKGRTHLKLVDYRVTITPDRMMYEFGNLFNGDVTLGAQINRILNENWQVIFEDVRAGYEESFGLIFKDLANRLFSRVPVKDIFIYE